MAMHSLPMGGRMCAWLREDNERHGLEVVEAERTGGFGLSLGDGEDARAEDFAHVGAVAEADGDDRRHMGGT